MAVVVAHLEGDAARGALRRLPGAWLLPAPAGTVGNVARGSPSFGCPTALPAPGMTVAHEYRPAGSARRPPSRRGPGCAHSRKPPIRRHWIAHPDGFLTRQDRSNGTDRASGADHPRWWPARARRSWPSPGCRHAVPTLVGCARARTKTGEWVSKDFRFAAVAGSLVQAPGRGRRPADWTWSPAVTARDFVDGGNPFAPLP